MKRQAAIYVVEFKNAPRRAWVACECFSYRDRKRAEAQARRASADTAHLGGYEHRAVRYVRDDAGKAGGKR